MISKIQRSWRQVCDATVIWNFQTSLETTICEVRLSFRCPLTPNSFFASVLPRTDWVVALKLTLPPGAGNPRYATDHSRVSADIGYEIKRLVSLSPIRVPRLLRPVRSAAISGTQQFLCSGNKWVLRIQLNVWKN